MSMTRLKIDSFFQEFPYLGDYFDAETVDEVRVSRISEATLDIYTIPGPPDGEYFGDRFILLDKNGRKLSEVGVYEWRWYRPFQRSGVFRETVLCALQRLYKRASDVHIILQCVPKYPEPNSRRQSFALTIMKAPRNQDVWSWVYGLSKANQAEVRKIRDEANSS
jgi:hypothetical protein